jgi:hypothetical protein
MWAIGRITEFIKQEKHPNVKVFNSINELANNL